MGNAAVYLTENHVIQSGACSVFIKYTVYVKNFTPHKFQVKL